MNETREDFRYASKGAGKIHDDEKQHHTPDFCYNVRFIGLIARYNTARNQKERLMAMYQMRNVHGQSQVYDNRGNFLCSADSEREAREELESYAESAA